MAPSSPIFPKSMEFLKLAQQRYSVRAYKPTPVEDTKLAQVLEAARLAPTASNRQPFQLIVAHVKGREVELQRIYARRWFVQAPLVICACSIHREGWVRDADGFNYATIDVAVAMDHLILAATSLGLGTCWVAAFNPIAARQVFGLPEGVDPVAFTPLGYPSDKPLPKARKPLADLVHYERW
jgi:nitroreductase